MRELRARWRRIAGAGEGGEWEGRIGLLPLTEVVVVVVSGRLRRLSFLEAEEGGL